MNRVEGKVAIVTGGVLEIGRATSMLFAKKEQRLPLLISRMNKVRML
jgi:NAD(P)-dependent dehydrogenase (short-subunit alcohol dehydrogenase family)